MFRYSADLKCEIAVKCRHSVRVKKLHVINDNLLK